MFNLKVSNSEKDTLDSLKLQLADKVITGFEYKSDPRFITVRFEMNGNDIKRITKTVKDPKSKKSIEELRSELKNVRGDLARYKYQCKKLRKENQELKKANLNRTIWEGGKAIPVHKLTIGG
jgi:ribosomal protein L29